MFEKRQKKLHPQSISIPTALQDKEIFKASDTHEQTLTDYETEMEPDICTALHWHADCAVEVTVLGFFEGVQNANKVGI